MSADQLIATAARSAALRRYADELQARIARGETDADLVAEAHAARLAALAAEAE